MRQLMAKYSQTSGEPAHVSISKSSTDSQPICQIVNAISKNHHPSHAGDVFRCRMKVRVCVAVTMVHHLMLGDNDCVMVWVSQGAGGGAGS